MWRKLLGVGAALGAAMVGSVVSAGSGSAQEEFPKDLVATVSPETVEPGGEVTVESVDDCPAPRRSGDATVIAIWYLGVDGSDEPEWIDQFNAGGGSSTEGSWREVFTAPETEGVYVLRIVCAKNWYADLVPGFYSAYTPLMFVVDGEGGAGPISPPPSPPTDVPPMPPKGPDPTPSSPAPAVPGTPQFTG